MTRARRRPHRRRRPRARSGRRVHDLTSRARRRHARPRAQRAPARRDPRRSSARTVPRRLSCALRRARKTYATASGTATIVRPFERALRLARAAGRSTRRDARGAARRSSAGTTSPRFRAPAVARRDDRARDRVASTLAPAGPAAANRVLVLRDRPAPASSATWCAASSARWSRSDAGRRPADGIGAAAGVARPGARPGRTAPPQGLFLVRRRVSAALAAWVLKACRLRVYSRRNLNVA